MVPDVLLQVGHDLSEVIQVVVHPLVQQVPDLDPADALVLTAPAELVGAQVGHEGGAGLAQRREPLEQSARSSS